MSQRAPSLRPKRIRQITGRDPFASSRLELIADAAGSVAIGWIATGVLYARTVGDISAEVGKVQAARIQGFAEAVTQLSFFIDASQLKQYDLLARSAFVRAVLANRRKFSELVMLSVAEGETPAEQSLVSVVGEPFDILRAPDDFEDRLLELAPQARHTIALKPSSTAQSSR